MELAGDAHAGGDAEAQLRREHAGQRILLAEDEPLNQEIVREILVDTGLVVDVAATGGEAVERVKQTPYAAVLMDMQMPGMDGLAATAAIRAMPDRTGIPIIAMTANAFSEDRQRCLEGGMNDYLSKPCYPDDLFAVLLRWLPPVRPS
jgi:CheY-like chemotaxis protein